MRRVCTNDPEAIVNDPFENGNILNVISYKNEMKKIFTK